MERRGRDGEGRGGEVGMGRRRGGEGSRVGGMEAEGRRGTVGLGRRKGGKRGTGERQRGKRRGAVSSVQDVLSSV